MKRILFVAFTLIVASSAFAQSNLPPGKWWRRPEIVQQLNLAEEQQNKRETIFRTASTDLIDLRGEVEKQNVALRGELDQPQLNRQAIVRDAGLGYFVSGNTMRIVSRRDLRRDPSGPSYLRLIAALYTIQLALFVVQETAEATFAGVPAGSIMTLLLWGTLGQLPVAAVAALALRWLAIRFEAAVEEIQELVGLVEPSPGVVPALPPAVIPTEADTLHSQIARSALHKRGPPYLLRSCSI